MDAKRLSEIYEAINMVAKESMEFTAEQRDNLLAAVAEKLKGVRTVHEKLIERVQNLESMLVLSVVSLSVKSGQPMKYEDKVGFARMLHVDWEASAKAFKSSHLH